MEMVGLCAICGRPGAMHTCRICGRNVCSEHFDIGYGVCSSCGEKINKHRGDIPP